MKKLTKRVSKKAVKTTWSPFDATDYLTSEEDIVAYLDAVMAEADGDPSVIAHALGDAARALGNMGRLAAQAGISREGLYKALSRSGNPSFVTVARVAQALGLELHFRPAKRRAA